MDLSDEQKRYIEFFDRCDTKLLATAGSGKTFCIIQHIRHLIDHNVYSPHHIFMLTFSKNAKDDFILKMKKYKVDEVPVKNINTIDSFAWAIMGEDIARSIDVSILSYSLFRILIEIKAVIQKQDSNPFLTQDDIGCLTPIITSFGIDHEDLINKLRKIKSIFVDEAQDLNEVQYNILLHLKYVCQAQLNLVGDPNQNIYQFRNSSDKYLLDYPAQTFHLTKNYRSKGHVVQFCSHLRPYNTSEITHTLEDERKGVLDVTFYSYANTSSFENYILSILHFFKAKSIPLHKVAILAPTRGYLRTVKGISKYKGLCYIANLLFKNDIPFQQFYNDMGNGGFRDGMNTTTEDASQSHSSASIPVSEIDSSKVAYRMKRGHINLMTYTASKGLEWDYVIIMDADAHLISRWEYDVNKFNAEKYLLYVACSRPRKNLIIFTKHRYTNPWFKDIPNDKYKLARICQDELVFFDSTKLFPLGKKVEEKKKEKEKEKEKIGVQNEANIDHMDIDMKIGEDHTTITPPSIHPGSSTPPPRVSVMSLVNILTDSELFDINTMLLPYIQKRRVMMIPTAKDGWKLRIPDNRQGFSSKFIEHLFYVHAFNTNLAGTPILRDIVNVINSKNIVFCNSNQIISWYFENREGMTWETYDVSHPLIHRKITEFIDSHFDRDQPFSSYTLVDKFYDAFIVNNYEKIKTTYKMYEKDPTCIDHVLFITLVSYAVESTHYFYILQYEKFYEEIIPKNEEAFRHIIHYAASLDLQPAMNSYKERIEDKDEGNGGGRLFTFIDFKINDVLHKLKPIGDDKLKDVINALMALVIGGEKGGEHQNICFNTIILSKGVLNKWEINVPSAVTRDIKNIIVAKILDDGE